MTQKLYYRFCDGLNDVGKFYPVEKSPYKVAKNLNKELFKSVYLYSKEQVKEAEKEIEVLDKEGNPYKRKRGVGRVTDSSGVKYDLLEPITNKLVFDFDAKDPEDARQDCITVVERLKEKGIDEDGIQVYFSGGKGFHCVVDTENEFKSTELKSICTVLADGLSSYDTVIYNPTRILRLPLSKHHSGLYTTPITLDELRDCSIDEIKDFARNPLKPEEIEGVFPVVKVPESILQMKELKLTQNVVKAKIEGFPETFDDVDFTKRPQYLTPAKYVLEMGYIPRGYGQEARMILASSYKQAGKSDKQAYYALKAVSDARVEIYGDSAKFDKDELWNNVITTVYSPNWQGGTYSHFHPLLAEIDDRLPAYLKRKERAKLLDNASVFDKFKSFARDIDKNTLKIGIPSFDSRVKLLAGTACGVLGVPGSGKSTLLMNLLANNSNAGEKGIFYSLDMGESLVALKQIQRVTNLNNDSVFSLVKEDPEEFSKLAKKAAKEFENVVFSFKFGLTPDDIRNDIRDYETKTGEKVRLVVVDYLENVQSGYNDPTVGAGVVAQQLADIANEMDVLIVIALQTQKSVKPGEEILTMRSIKGASVIEQCLSVAIGIYREGQPLKYQDYDVTMGINVLKNRYGSCSSNTVGWDGAKSKIMEMTNDQKLQLAELRDMKKEEADEAEKEGRW